MTDEDLRDLLLETKVIAVVGLVALALGWPRGPRKRR